MNDYANNRSFWRPTPPLAAAAANPERGECLTVPIVVVSGYGWASGDAGRPYALTEALSNLTTIYYLALPEPNRSFFRAPRPQISRISRSLTIIENSYGIRTARGGKRLGRLGAVIDAAWIHALLRQDGVRDYVLWIAAPAPRLLWNMRQDRLVYDCIDPCFVPEHQRQLDAIEFGIAKKAKLVFATAQSLHQRMQSMNANSHLLCNATSAEQFHPDRAGHLPRPAPIRDHKGPIIGYMGTFDWRVDTEILTHAAKALPQFTFCLVGRVNPDQEHRVTELRKLLNVVLPGRVSTEEGLAYTAAFDVGLIPFLPGPMGDAINPVKMYMYLMAGKPVVGTDINECRRFSEFVVAAKNPAQFASAIQAAVETDTPTRRAARTAFAMQNRWEDRAAEAVRILNAQGLLES
jgi:glycosyltransferase involved in cell wall biosynthesis